MDRLRLEPTAALVMQWSLKLYKEEPVLRFINQLDLSSGKNLYDKCHSVCDWYDEVILNRKSFRPYDPEGLFSTLPAVVTVLAGYFTGQWLKKQPRKSPTSVSLVISGLVCLVVGSLWGLVFPINKALWTSSYVVVTAGWALLLLAACYEAIEVRGWHRWGRPFEVMGLNAIFLFVVSGIVARILIFTKIGTGENAPSIKSWLYDSFFQPWAGDFNGSLAFAIANILLWWLVLYWMYRQKWFLKV